VSRRRVLEDSAGALDLPFGVRSRVLAEVAADADALYAHFRRAGDDEVTAVMKVEQRLGLTGEAAAELGELYLPAWPRLLRRFAPGREHVLERWLLIATAVVFFGFGVSGMVQLRLLDGSVFPWLVLIPGVLSAAWATAKMFQLLVKRDDSPERLRSRLDVLWLSGSVALMASAAGTLTSLWRLLSAAGARPDDALPLLIGWARYASDLLATGLGTGLAALLTWFLVESRAMTHERMERELMERRATWSVF